MQDITADGDIECLLIDMDTDGFDENRISLLHILNGQDTVNASVCCLEPVINPGFVEYYFGQVLAGE